MNSIFSDQELPAVPGSYLLRLRLVQPVLLQVGRLGHFMLPAGDFIYSGSACGPGGLRARLGRHLFGSGIPHWHIDYLRAVTLLCDFAYHIHPEKARPLQKEDIPLECFWSQKLASLPYTQIIMPGFGASDCHNGCRSHLLAAFPEFDEDILLNLLSIVPKPPL